MTKVQAQAHIAVALMEAAAKLLAQANTEGPKGKHEFGREVAAINRSIHGLQQRMIRIIDAPEKGEK